MPLQNVFIFAKRALLPKLAATSATWSTEVNGNEQHVRLISSLTPSPGGKVGNKSPFPGIAAFRITPNQLIRQGWSKPMSAVLKRPSMQSKEHSGYSVGFQGLTTYFVVLRLSVETNSKAISNGLYNIAGKFLIRVKAQCHITSR